MAKPGFEPRLLRFQSQGFSPRPLTLSSHLQNKWYEIHSHQIIPELILWVCGLQRGNPSSCTRQICVLLWMYIVSFENFSQVQYTCGCTLTSLPTAGQMILLAYHSFSHCRGCSSPRTVLMANRKGHVIHYPSDHFDFWQYGRWNWSPTVPPCYKHIEIIDKIQQNNEDVLKSVQA